MTPIAYLAQPIDQVVDRDVWLRATAQIHTELSRLGYTVYQPARAWRVPLNAELDGRLEAVNREALGQADLLVAYLPAGVPSIGVPMEIAQALQDKIPVVAITTVQSYSLQRPGIHIVADSTEIEAAIKMANSGHTLPVGEPIRLVVREGHRVPARTYPDDAGLDLTTLIEYTIRPGQFVDIHTQVDAVQLPDGYWGLITGRSSTLRKHGLHVPVAVIDPGWRGPLFVGVWNLSPQQVLVQPGDRLGQLILVPNTPAPVLAVAQVAEAERGLAGFGSSGS